MTAPLHWPLGVATVTAIQDYEGCKLIAYKCPAGVWTIGYGSTGKGVLPGVAWTKAQAGERFLRDLWDTAMGVTQLLGGSYCHPLQFEALVSFAYNCGLDIDTDSKAEGLGDSSLLRKHKAGDFEGAAKEFGKWIHAGGRALPGLVKRRRWEAGLYRSGIPS